MSIVSLILIIMGIVVVGLVSLFFYYQFKEKDEPENSLIFENYHPMHSDGHTDGLVKGIEIGEKRIGITFVPRDINYVREIIVNKNKNFKPKEYTIFYDKRQVESFPQGLFSTHRGKIKAFPSDPKYLPEGVKRTNFGKILMGHISKNQRIKEESELMEKRMSSLQDLSEKNFGGKIFTDTIKTLRGGYELKEKRVEDKREEKK